MNTIWNPPALMGLKTFVLVCLSAMIAGASPSRADLQPGDIVVADSQGALIQIDSITGQSQVVSAGGNLVRPFGVVFDAAGHILVTDTGALAIISVDPSTGSNSVVSSGGILGVPFGIAVDRNGNIFVANAEAIIRVDPQTGLQTKVTSGGLLRVPVGVAIAPNGSIYVADLTGSVLRVDPGSGQQTAVSTGGYLVNPVGILLDGARHVLVADETAHAVIRVNLQTGRQTVLSSGGAMVTPVSIAYGANSDLLVGDPDANDLNGGVIGIDRASNIQRSLYTGTGDLVNPRGVAVVPSDADQDSVAGLLDKCLGTLPEHLMNASGCSINQLVPCSGLVSGGAWESHSQYVSTVRRVAREFLNAGMINAHEQNAIARQARHSNCGR